MLIDKNTGIFHIPHTVSAVIDPHLNNQYPVFFSVKVWNPNQLVILKAEALNGDFDTDIPKVSTSKEKTSRIRNSKSRRCRRRPIKYEVDSDAEDETFCVSPSDLLMPLSKRLRRNSPFNNPDSMDCKDVKLVDADLVLERRRFVCDKCPKRFSTKYGLSQHTKYECRKEPRFECAYCPFKCKRPWVINEHLRRKHSGEDMYYFDNDDEV